MNCGVIPTLRAIDFKPSNTVPSCVWSYSVSCSDTLVHGMTRHYSTLKTTEFLWCPLRAGKKKSMTRHKSLTPAKLLPAATVTSLWAGKDRIDLKTFPENFANYRHFKNQSGIVNCPINLNRVFFMWLLVVLRDAGRAQG